MISKLKDAISTAFVLTAVDRGASMAQKSSSADAPKTDSMIPQHTETASQAAMGQVAEAAQAEKFGNKPQKDSEKKQLDEETVSNLTEELNKLMNEINCNLEFKYSKEVNIMSVKMVDRETQEVIKEYPPEEMIEGMIKAREWLGAFLDKNA